MTAHPYVCLLPPPPGVNVIGIAPVPGRMDQPLHRLPGERMEQLLYRARQAMHGDGIVIVSALLREG